MQGEVYVGEHGTHARYQDGVCRCEPSKASEATYHVRYANGLIPG
jgi:hypothetical protein